MAAAKERTVGLWRPSVYRWILRGVGARASLTALRQNAVVRRILGRHHLLAPSDADIAQVADDVVGLHATSPLTPHHSLHERVRGFLPVDLDDALYEQRDLVRVKTMRGTVFVLTRRLAPVAVAATRGATVASDRRWLGTNDDVFRRLAPRVLDAVAGEALAVTELRKIIGGGDDLSGVVAMLCDEGQLVRDRPVGGRASTTFRYRLWTDALPDVRLDEYDEMDATRELLHRYLDSYGPVSRADLVWWTGLPARKIDDAVRGLKTRLVNLSVAGLGDDLLMTAEGADEAASVGSGPVAINLVPMLDPYTMGCKDRRRLLDPEQNETVIDRGGNVTSVILVDGRVAGVWDLAEVPEPAARVLLFDAGHRHRRRILEHAGASAEWWFGEPVPVEEYAAMVPLRQRSGVMRRPLDAAHPRREQQAPSRRRNGPGSTSPGLVSSYGGDG